MIPLREAFPCLMSNNKQLNQEFPTLRQVLADDFGIIFIYSFIVN